MYDAGGQSPLAMTSAMVIASPVDGLSGGV
jgi:hypothetical protein